MKLLLCKGTAMNGGVSSKMKLVYDGKTKAVYELENGNYLLKLKDDVTGENGRIDPGANTVMGKLEGMGNASLRMTEYYFTLLNKQGLNTHFISADLANNTMTVVPAQQYGKGIEIICRFVAYGSFVRRYGLYAENGQPLNSLVEITLKDDSRGDPLITDEALAQLNIITMEQYQDIKTLVRNVANLIKTDLAAKGLELYDIKFEVGKDPKGNVMIIDDISGGIMRVFKDGKQVGPLELADMVIKGA